MRVPAGAMLLVPVLVMGCPQGKYDKLPDAAESDRAAAEKLWSGYLGKLGSPKVSKDPLLVAPYFSSALLAHTTEEEFNKQVGDCLRKRSTGIFEDVDVAAVKTSQDGFLLVVDSKAGQAGIPLVREDDRLKFAELQASTGIWTDEAKPGPVDMPDSPSLLYIKMILTDEQAPVGKRLRAAVSLAEPKYRKDIIKHQRSVNDPIVRLGLGLARIKIDGSDESFVKGFPTDAVGISALAQADPRVFEEMITKLSNMGGMVEDPPVNETLYRVAGGAPPDLHARMGQALYRMAELNPARMANAVRNVSKDPASDPVFDLYLAEVKRQGGKSPKMAKFLKKFSRIGEPAEKKLCKTLLNRLDKAR